MKTVTMTSPKMAGEVIFTYNEFNHLQSLQITEDIKNEQYQFLCANMPWLFDQLARFSSLTKDATFVERAMEVTFDMFWNRYNDKERSSKKKTLTAWDKLTTTNQVKAYYYIPVYFRKRGTADKKYATTYLNDELWNN